MNKVPMTANGFNRLKDELRWRQQEERPRIIEAISEARSHGDLSENAEYHSAKEAQSHNEGRIVELEDFIARAEVIDVSKLSGEKVKFGATVVLLDEDTEEKKTYQIVGDQEADVRSGRISISSPIARALIGKEVGDAIEVNAPGGARGYEIVSVRSEPETVEVSGPESALKQLREAITEPIAVTDRTETMREVVTVGVADPTVRVRSPQTATVTVTIAAVK